MSIPLFAFVVVAGAPFLAATPAETLLKKSDDWFLTGEGREAVEHILTWQTGNGDWPKNVDTTGSKGSGKDAEAAGTFDNGATTGELRALARAYRVVKDERMKVGFLRGFDHLLTAQYPNGGWPQFFPLSSGYHRHITFNDGTMIRVMEFFDDAAGKEDFAFLTEEQRESAAEAVRRGVDCILRCQIKVDEKLTVWCAQHDAESLAPVLARTYEHPSLSGAESAGILLFLMNRTRPTPEIIKAIKGGVSWFASAGIVGYRYSRSSTGPALIKDPQAPTLWARFYEIGSNRPIFSDRDGVVKYHLEEIGSERRGGYSWYGNWGDRVATTYGEWPHRCPCRMPPPPAG